MEVVHRDIEEPLHLLCMQIHRQHATHPGSMQQIRHQFGCNRDARLVLSVLARVSEKWNHRSDPIRAGASCCVHHDEQLHQMLVSWRAGWLNDENVVTAYVFLDSY